MTPSDSRDDLPPEQAAVRRMLEDARHDEPVPPDVAARLDTVLAELSAERGGRAAPSPGAGAPTADPPRPAAPVVDLGARRRRGVGVALMAAAAVVVAGVGIGQVIQVGGQSDDAGAGSAADSDYAESGSDGSEKSAPEAEVGEDGAPLDAARERLVPDVSSGSLREDLDAALVAVRGAQASGTAGPDDSGAESSLRSACPPVDEASVGAGRQVPVTFDGRRALAVYRVPQGGRREVDVYLCDSDVLAASAVIPAR